MCDFDMHIGILGAMEIVQSEIPHVWFVHSGILLVWFMHSGILLLWFVHSEILLVWFVHSEVLLFWSVGGELSTHEISMCTARDPFQASSNHLNICDICMWGVV